MKIHEYQAKTILSENGISVPDGHVCFSVEEAVDVATRIGGNVWVVKAQIHAGGRGKGGGVKVAHSLEQVHQYAEAILGMNLVTHQTGPEGQPVKRLLIEEGVEINSELYVGMVVDRSRQKIVIMASSEGGTEIEEIAARQPDKIHKAFIEPSAGLTMVQALELCEGVGLPQECVEQGVKCMLTLYQTFYDTDASLVEINPLAITVDHKVMALDAKFNFDDNAAFRHPEREQYRDYDEENPVEVRAANVGLNYISLDGNIGCLVNGAGLAMATMDIIKLYGGEPANFLDVGGGATSEQVTEAFKIMLENPGLQAILVNIFGGIMRCDVIAEGLITAAKSVNLKVPLVVRLEGTNVEKARTMLAEADIDMNTAENMADAAKKVVAAAHQEFAS